MSDGPLNSCLPLGKRCGGHVGVHNKRVCMPRPCERRPRCPETAEPSQALHDVVRLSCVGQRVHFACLADFWPCHFLRQSPSARRASRSPGCGTRMPAVRASAHHCRHQPAASVRGYRGLTSTFLLVSLFPTFFSRRSVGFLTHDSVVKRQKGMPCSTPMTARPHSMLDSSCHGRKGYFVGDERIIQVRGVVTVTPSPMACVAASAHSRMKPQAGARPQAEASGTISILYSRLPASTPRSPGRPPRPTALRMPGQACSAGLSLGRREDSYVRRGREEGRERHAFVPPLRVFDKMPRQRATIALGFLQTHSVAGAVSAGQARVGGPHKVAGWLRVPPV